MKFHKSSWSRLGILFSIIIALEAYAEDQPTVSNPDTSSEPSELKRQIDLLGQEIQKLKIGEAGSEVIADRQQYGFGPAMSKVYRTQQGFSIGGYGDLLFERFATGFDNTGKRVAPGEDFSINDGQARFDMTRAVLYIGYKFNDNWVFNSELEFEHGGKEVAVEFFYMDYFWKPFMNFRFGNLLVPMGLTNETHEPTTYLGTHRPLLETLIIPTTWSEYGGGFFGSAGPFTYRSYLMAGLNASGFDALNGIQNGRFERGFTNATQFQWITRLDFTAIPGLLPGVSFNFGNATTTPASGFSTISIPISMAEAHLQMNLGGLHFRAMAAYTLLSNVDQLNARAALAVNNSIGNQQGGFYLETGYDLVGAGQQSLIPFARYEFVSTQLGVPVGYTPNGAGLVRAAIAGICYKPLSQLVLKADYQWNMVSDGSGIDQFNLAMGYVF